jgi:hypothetical protein
MATSGLNDWILDTGGVIEEAAERARLSPSNLTPDHLQSALRSLDFVLNELSLRDADSLFMIIEERIDLLVGERAFILPPGTVDVLDVTAVQTGVTSAQPLPLSRLSWQQWLYQTNKTLTSQVPSAYTVAKQREIGSQGLYDLLVVPIPNGYVGTVYGNNPAAGPIRQDPSTAQSPVMIIWPVPTATTRVTYHRMRWHQRAGGMAYDLDATRSMYDTIAEGLAARLAAKYSDPNVAAGLSASYEKKRREALIETRDRAPVHIAVRGFGRQRTRRI